MQFDSPMAICDNGNMSQMVKSLLLNKMNIPAVELYIVQSYADKSRPNAVARFFASDLQGYESLCKMVEIAARNKYYSPRLEINDIILDGDVTAIVDEDFIFLEEFPREKTFVAVNAESNLANPVYLRNNPIFYYDSYALHQSDLGIIELLSARQFKHETKCWYYDLSHFAAASMIQGAVENYCALCSRHTAPVISFENRYPIFEPSTEETFDALIEAGFARKCAGKGPEYRERLDFEAGVIKRMGYTSYFNINWDFIHWAREHDIPIGPGRGSAAGSLVAYCLDITKLDPVANGLYFERFLNPERVSPPDIDTDIAANDRQRVIEYVRTRYGRDRVSQIVSFSVLKSKSALKDAARLFAIPAEEMDGITKQFPLSVAGEPPTLEDAYEVAGVQAWANRHPLVWKEAKNLEGFIRQTTVNAAGVIIAPKPLRELTGMSYVDDEYVCQLDKVDSEKFGLLKMDLLGLITLDVIKLTLEQLGKSYYDMENTPLDDAKVIAEFAKGNTYGIFQFESGGMRKLLIQVAPKTFADIAATTAFYRPGPLNSGLTTQYVHNRHSSNPIYFLPEFKELLAETAGRV